MKLTDKYEPGTIEHQTGTITYATYYNALNEAAPPYYLSDELLQALRKTSPVLPANAPIALPSFHLMLPVNIFSAAPAAITAICSRNIDQKRFQLEAKHSPDALLLSIVIRMERALIAFTAFIKPDFSEVYLTPDIDDIIFDDNDALELYQSMRVMAAKLVVNALLIMQYQPELVTVESSCHGRGAGFGSAANKAAANYFPTRWLGKSYQRKQSNSPHAGSHASPRAHWRKGHWHNFRYGPGRKELKLKWIEPIFVNP